MTITYAQLKAKLERDMDIEDEEFVQTDELREYFNDAIRECESHIHKLGLEDIYFKSSDAPSLVLGTSQYAMPSNIYLNKIVECVYANQNDIFEVRRLKGRNKHYRKAQINFDTGTQPAYIYDILNDSAAVGTKWELIPPSKETSTNITRWYIRKAEQMLTDASVCDLPEICYTFIYAFVTWRVWGKEGDQRATDAKMTLDEQRELLITTLKEMTPDEDNIVEADTSSYDEMS